MLRHILPLLLVLAATLRAQEFDVLVYGATPAGIAAAVAAAEDGERVLLVEPTARIGGMVTNGLSHTDFRTFEGLNGAFLDFSKRVEAYYRETYGADSPQVKDCIRGTQAEPKVNLLVFEKMLADQPRIKVQREWALDGVKSSSNGDGESPATWRALEVALFYDAAGAYHSVAAHYFIDATYEGDLMAAARVPYRVGREAGEEYGELLAPDQADDQLQAYNFRLIATQDPANRVMPRKPKGYRREEFLDVLRLFENGQIEQVFGYPSKCLYKAQIPRLPNGKYDINDVSGGIVRLSLPGENDGWPEGESGFAARIVQGGAIAPFSRTGLRQSRQPIFDAHLLWDVGLLYFLQNDEAVPEKFRDEAREWGWCRDEFLENGHVPEQLYVREGRRMIGQYVRGRRQHQSVAQVVSHQFAVGADLEAHELRIHLGLDEHVVERQVPAARTGAALQQGALGDPVGAQQDLAEAGARLLRGETGQVAEAALVDADERDAGLRRLAHRAEQRAVAANDAAGVTALEVAPRELAGRAALDPADADRAGNGDELAGQPGGAGLLGVDDKGESADGGHA